MACSCLCYSVIERRMYYDSVLSYKRALYEEDKTIKEAVLIVKL
jgi:hypothetical protein